ncbi:hypothetical protein DDL59_07480 [Neisseria gonorrhoeae]|nr:hypothetical protein M721_06135 [Neisseria gonorrhoeae ALB_2011_03_03]KLS38628.1 hypothetical protein M724_10480 [Neisseria gonorrhoeae ATL_2011_01_05]OIA42041.1 hypothetical protein BB008_10775 [Neisseria gonorrhoeae]OIA42416.1 hypothetical protein BB010_00175 [Neisseria gonorrhoeae]OIA43617.1 hypothetical protein BB005_05915 [Neisseria gonorrhoeae]
MGDGEMAYINILAGDFHKGKAVLKKDCIVLSRGGKVALLDIAGYEVQDGGVIEVVFFDGRRMLVEKNDAFLQAVKVALYNEPQNPEERRQQYNQRQVNSAAKAKKAKKIKLIVGGIFVLLFVAMCAVPKKELTPEEKAAAEKQKIDGKIASGVREFKYDKKAYPKLYKQWGEKAVNEMNGYLPRIAEHIAREDSCDAVETVDISDSRSNPKAKQMVFFVDCRNGKRFFVSTDDLNSGRKSTAEQDKKIDSSAVISQCDEAIKAQLNHPRTFDPHILDTATGVNQNGNVLVTRGFTAKNGLGMQIDYRAYCVITDNKVEVSIEQK